MLLKSHRARETRTAENDLAPVSVGLRPVCLEWLLPRDRVFPWEWYQGTQLCIFIYIMLLGRCGRKEVVMRRVGSE